MNTLEKIEVWSCGGCGLTFPAAGGTVLGELGTHQEFICKSCS